MGAFVALLSTVFGGGATSFVLVVAVGAYGVITHGVRAHRRQKANQARSEADGDGSTLPER